MREIILAEEFSKHPAGRFKTDGPYSGELFREEFLEPLIRGHERTVIYLDGARGYGSSFLEEAFGGLARQFSTPTVTELITLVSRDNTLIERINTYIKDAKGRKASTNNFARRAMNAWTEPR
ncbi:STAS-like domain-containing protein [Pseudomonas syringae]|uniref:STAS-like domain-containing protein n=1 Tax=Pseudomonas syringae TaxID=317 RepID=UPI003204B052